MKPILGVSQFKKGCPLYGPSEHQDNAGECAEGLGSDPAPVGGQEAHCRLQGRVQLDVPTAAEREVMGL